MKGLVHISQWPLVMPHGDHDLLLAKDDWNLSSSLLQKMLEEESGGEVGRSGGLFRII